MGSKKSTISAIQRSELYRIGSPRRSRIFIIAIEEDHATNVNEIHRIK